MATTVGEVPYRERSLFARRATGLVRGWSAWDGFVYATFSINLITLGLFIFSFAVFVPNGNLLWAVVLSGAYLLLQVITYASLIAAMPRAGGDYIWISRILGGGLGFVLAVCGWWFILWHWVPIYANILNVEVFVPLGAIVAGADSGWVSFFSEPKGLFWSSVIVAVVASLIISLGMRMYARFQKICFYGGLVGLAFMFVLLVINSKTDFISAFNAEAQSTLGTPANGYQATLDAAGVGEPGVGEFGAAQGLFLLIPFVLFFNLWSNWGATLYGEVRGASDFRKNVAAMGGALVFTTIAAVVMFLLFAKTFGWDFYNAANNSYWGQAALYDYVDNAPVTYFPYPGLLASFLMDSSVAQFILVSLLALWFFGWVGTVFLSSTRVVFAAAFDRVLPEAASKVTRNGVPIAAILLMLIPSIPISYFYAYDADGFQTWTLGATLVIAITFFGSAVAAAILPWRKREIYNASPIARYNVAGVPLITLAATGFMIILGFALYKWFSDELYALNNRDSLIYLGSLYGLALAIYAVSRFVRRSQGIDMSMVHREIPVE
jgi:APA family basic amino acid/polyamine antiporter